MLSAPSPFSLVIFGASGHLAKLKLYPALYVLLLKKRLPKDFAIIGFARSDLSDDSFKDLVAESIKSDMPEVNQKVLQDLLDHCHYHQGQYTETADFENLAQKLSEVEHNDTWVRLAYLSVPPVVFSDVLKNLCGGKVHCHSREGDFRCIVEKPVGNNLESFEDVKKELTDCFKEDEVFLLDHYLGKEAVRNVYYLRFANPILERLFKNTLIKHVEITAFENAGLDGRAGYFDAVGTFRDMFQSHLLEVASLLTMRLQEEHAIRDSRLNALTQFYLPPAPDLNDAVLQGQYEGYTKEEGVDTASKANTFAALKLMTRMSRWEGVPFYLRSGKMLDKKETRISIAFQEPSQIGKGATSNRLDIILQGEAGMKMYLQTKMGGTDPAFRPLIMEDPLVCVGDCLPEHGLLILEAIHGKQQWYLSFDEVHTAWRLVDTVQAHLQKEDTPLYIYKQGSRGPKEADEWIKKDSIEWF
jgi:glucose-6-phosphate 1-dehydrogenase